ncbi:N-acetylglucosaminyl transferase component-domain-containing protein [Cyathus striatus]|nr:N-acetylglucosaminyl transferase component-domain-containing protein [Cyathus striatus]
MGQRATYSKLLPRTASTLLSLGSLASLLWNPVSILCQGVSVLGSVHVTPRLTLKDVSAIAQQIDVRAEQVDFFASEVENIRQRSMSDVPTYAARYTNFFNTVWLILNDLTIGIAFGTFLCENRLFFARMLNRTVEHVLIVWLQWVLGWLDSWPAGLKLNTELSWFYSHTLIDLVNTWGRILQAIMHYMPAIVYGVGIISCWAGATMAISVSMDILALVSTHIYVCYFANRMVYRRMLLTAASLWNLFRGKRYNVLRNRTDSWEYDIDQLLFGTILFTLLAFLFPTVLVYYALFASLRLCTLLLQAGMDSLLAFMNHFPLFALMLRLKDPWRLPGGICIGITQVENKPPIFVVENQPVSLGFIFFQYIQLSSRLARHYNPLRLLYHVLAGEYLTPIPRYSIRYNKMVQTHAHNL